MASRNEIPANPRITRVIPGVFDIEGRSGTYTVRKGQGCSCPAAVKGRRSCWHMEAVKAYALQNPLPTPASLASRGGQYAPAPVRDSSLDADITRTLDAIRKARKAA